VSFYCAFFHQNGLNLYFGKSAYEPNKLKDLFFLRSSPPCSHAAANNTIAPPSCLKTMDEKSSLLLSSGKDDDHGTARQLPRRGSRFGREFQLICVTRPKSTSFTHLLIFLFILQPILKRLECVRLGRASLISHKC
jgi:hypothetical protein